MGNFIPVTNWEKQGKNHPNMVVAKFPSAIDFSGQAFIGDAVAYRSSKSHFPYTVWYCNIDIILWHAKASLLNYLEYVTQHVLPGCQFCQFVILPLYPCYCGKILMSDHFPLTGFSSVMQYFLLNFGWACLWIFIKYLVNIGVLK